MLNIAQWFGLNKERLLREEEHDGIIFDHSEFVCTDDGYEGSYVHCNNCANKGEENCPQPIGLKFINLLAEGCDYFVFTDNDNNEELNFS